MLCRFYLNFRDALFLEFGNKNFKIALELFLNASDRKSLDRVRFFFCVSVSEVVIYFVIFNQQTVHMVNRKCSISRTTNTTWLL